MSEDIKQGEQTEGKAAQAEEAARQPAEQSGGDAEASAGASAGETGAESVRKRKPRGKQVPIGVAHIKATFNNTQVSITDLTGAVISWGTAGRCGFKGARKSTAFAATTVAQEAARAAMSQGMSEVTVRVQGPGSGRESAIRGLQSAGLNVTAIQDVTPIPHNGCRPPKRRRV